MDRLTRAEHFRKMAVKYEDLARFTQPACLSDFYRSYAMRYGLMAQEASERAEKDENTEMRVLENNYGWSLIETAPFDEDVMLEVTDGQGERYRLPNPCRLTASGWVSSINRTPLVVTPVGRTLQATAFLQAAPPGSPTLARADSSRVFGAWAKDAAGRPQSEAGAPVGRFGRRHRVQ
jgi:hypothetical protein